MRIVTAKKMTPIASPSRVHLNQPSFHKQTPRLAARKRSQLVENGFSDTQEIFQNWLLRTGHSPKAGLPASQIGIYTDFQ